MLATRSVLDVRDAGGVRVYNTSIANASDSKEHEAYCRTKEGRGANIGSELFDDIAFKASSIKTFTHLLPWLKLSGHERVLEMGAGQGWASVLVKRAYPTCHVIASDLVPAALDFAVNYENLLNVFVDEKWAFNCRDIPFEDNQLDRIFTFAAFHHFGDDNEFGPALAEMVRVLKPGGKILLLYEPSSPEYLYKFMYKRVNQRRNVDGVDEDVIVPSRMKRYEETLPCSVKVEFFPFPLYRDSFKASAYYSGLSRFGFLPRRMVCTVNVEIEKRG